MVIAETLLVETMEQGQNISFFLIALDSWQQNESVLYPYPDAQCFDISLMQTTNKFPSEK